MMKNKILNFGLLLTMMAFLLAGCTSTTAASSWPGIVTSAETGFVSYGAQTFAVDLKNGSLLWQYPAEADRARQAYSAPAVGEDFVVMGDYTGSLVAVDVENGTKEWEFSSAVDRYVGSAAVDGDLVYAPNTDNYLYALDSQGSLNWKFKAEGPNWTKPLTDEKNVYFASMDHILYAVDQSFAANALEVAEDGTKTLRTDIAWSIDLGNAIVADPVLVDGVIYVATIEGKLAAVDARDGSVLWSFNNGGNLGSIWGAPVFDGSTIFFADVNGNVYTVDSETGKQLWPSAFSAGGKIVGGGVLTSEGVVFATEEGKVFLINSEKEPKTLSNFENAIYSPLGIGAENIIVAPGTKEALLSAVDLNGFEVWSFVPAE